MSDVLPILLGAGLSLVATTTIEVVKARIAASTRRELREAELLTRWDTQLAAQAAATLEAAWRLRHAAGASPVSAEAIVDRHEQFRAAIAPIRLIGNRAVQLAAREALRHAHAVRQVALGNPDPRPEKGADARVPEARFVDALEQLQINVRIQLQIPGGDDVLTEHAYRELYSDPAQARGAA